MNSTRFHDSGPHRDSNTTWATISLRFLRTIDNAGNHIAGDGSPKPFFWPCKLAEIGERSAGASTILWIFSWHGETCKSAMELHDLDSDSSRCPHSDNLSESVLRVGGLFTTAIPANTALALACRYIESTRRDCLTYWPRLAQYLHLYISDPDSRTHERVLNSKKTENIADSTRSSACHCVRTIAERGCR